MADDLNNVASLPSASVDHLELPDPDEDFLDLYEAPPPEPNIDPTEFEKPNKDELKKGVPEEEEQFILGTLVVRVVAARDLEPVSKAGLGEMVFGGNRSSGSLGRNAGGSSNPYASVKFGKCTQRTSEVFDTLDPIWPRQETMFMDVSLPASSVTHAEHHESFLGDSASIPRESSSPRSNEREAYTKPQTVMTVALFHTPEVGRVNKYPNKGGGQMIFGDSDDMFLGMASVDLTCLLTGRERTIDTWLRLAGTETSRGSVRVVCEYEASDSPPRPGDTCRFTRFCQPRYLYPLECGKEYSISEVDGDMVLISYTSQEGWVCSFEAHRFMLVCQERQQNAVETAQDELASIAERLTYSPLVHSVTATVERVAVDGLLNVGEEVVHGGFSLLNRWFSGGVGTVVQDVAEVTNWDGRHNPANEERLGIPEVTPIDSTEAVAPEASRDPNTPVSENQEALPNMPCCPITGEPMLDPVVAADGHTYERSAIARWFTTSDKSPMTGAVLGHKELVPNYGLMSSVQEAASKESTKGNIEALPDGNDETDKPVAESEDDKAETC